MITRTHSLGLAALLVALPATADMSGSGSSSDGDSGDGALAEVRGEIEAERYDAAIDRLDGLREERPDHPDVFNLLGYSHRKLGHYDRAERYYLRALELEPEHRGANEYLGELYLETDRPAKARERLRVLDDACFFGCEEYDELEAAIRAYEGGAD